MSVKPGPQGTPKLVASSKTKLGKARQQNMACGYLSCGVPKQVRDDFRFIISYMLPIVMLNLFHCCPVKDLNKTFTGQPVEKWLRYFQ
jgi:hypothetical protein